MQEVGLRARALVPIIYAAIETFVAGSLIFTCMAILGTFEALISMEVFAF